MNAAHTHRRKALTLAFAGTLVFAGSASAANISAVTLDEESDILNEAGHTLITAWNLGNDAEDVTVAATGGDLTFVGTETVGPEFDNGDWNLHPTTTSSTDTLDKLMIPWFYPRNGTADQPITFSDLNEGQDYRLQLLMQRDGVPGRRVFDLTLENGPTGETFTTPDINERTNVIMDFTFANHNGDGTLDVIYGHNDGTDGALQGYALHMVPEPGSLALLGLGGVMLMRRRARQ